MAERKFSAVIEGGDEIHLILDLDGSQIKNHKWNIIGSLALLEKAKAIKANFPQTLTELQVPTGKDSASLLLKEVLLRAKGEWNAGDDDPEVCHCRKISQRSIERAIILGANTIEKVRKRTSANTGCGACMPDVLDLINKRLS